MNLDILDIYKLSSVAVENMHDRVAGPISVSGFLHNRHTELPLLQTMNACNVKVPTNQKLAAEV